MPSLIRCTAILTHILNLPPLGGLIFTPIDGRASFAQPRTLTRLACAQPSLALRERCWTQPGGLGTGKGRPIRANSRR